MNAPNGVLANDTDPEDDPLTATLVDTPDSGTVTLNTDGSFNYEPDADFNGTDTFTYKANDGTDDSNVATVTINVASVNDAPEAADDTASTPEDTPATVNVLANDNDADGDTLSVQSASDPASGTATVNSDGTITYTPDADTNGAATFTYTVSDGTVTATVTVNVSATNDAPVAENDTRTTPEDTELRIPQSDLLANDSAGPNESDQSLSITEVSAPQHGTVSLDNATGDVIFTPEANYSGPASFTYTVSDGQGNTSTATANVNVTVESVNDTPTISDVADQSIREDQSTVPLDFAVGDQETATENLTITATSDNQTLVPDDNITVEGTGADRTVSVAPAANESGEATITLKVSDGTDTATDTFVLTVTSVNDAPSAADDTKTVAEDGELTFPASNLAANDSDADGDTLSITGVDQPLSGKTIRNDDGTITYKPDSNFNGTDRFFYTVSDGKGGFDTATVTVNVSAVNDGPDTTNDSSTTDEDNARTINVLRNDLDAEDDALSVVAAGSKSGLAPTNGSVSTNADGTITYTPDANFHGMDTFNYRASDGKGGTSSGRVTVTVASVNDKPTIRDNTFTMDEDKKLIRDKPSVLNNDDDVELGQLAVAGITSRPDHGQLTFGQSGSFTYTPNRNYNGKDSFTYRACDSGTPQRCDQGVVNITINGVRN